MFYFSALKMNLDVEMVDAFQRKSGVMALQTVRTVLMRKIAH
jgi:hypothetical protein